MLDDLENCIKGMVGREFREWLASVVQVGCTNDACIYRDNVFYRCRLKSILIDADGRCANFKAKKETEK